MRLDSISEVFRSDKINGWICVLSRAKRPGKWSKKNSLFFDFRQFQRALEPNQEPFHNVASKVGKIKLRTTQKLEHKGAQNPETIIRTKEFLHYPDGTGPVKFDYDQHLEKPSLTLDEFFPFTPFIEFMGRVIL